MRHQKGWLLFGNPVVRYCSLYNPFEVFGYTISNGFFEIERSVDA